MSCRILLGSCAVLVAAVSGCRETATQVVLYVDSAAGRAEISTFEVAVISGDGAVDEYSWMRGEGAASMGIIPPNPGALELGVTAMIRGSGTRELGATVRFDRFLEHRSVRVHVCLEERCAPGGDPPCFRHIADLAAIDEDEEARRFNLECRRLDPITDGGAPDLQDSSEPEPEDAGSRDAIGPELPPRPPPAPWTRKIGGTGDDAITDVAIDERGNIFVSGAFTGVLIFAGTTVTSTHGESGFIASYDSAGAERWIAAIESEGASRIFALAPGRNGDLYATGTITRAARLLGEPFLLDGPVLDDRGELLVVRIADGEPPVLTDQVLASGSGLQRGRAIAVDQRNFVHVAGGYTASFSLGGARDVPYSGGETEDVFWTVFDQNLDRCVTVHTFSSAGEDLAEDLKASQISPAVFLAGSMGDDLSVDGDNGPNGIGGPDVFLARLELSDSLAEELSIRRIGGERDETAPRLATEPNGKVHATAAYSTSAVLLVDQTIVQLSSDMAALDLTLDETSPFNISVSRVRADAAVIAGRGVAYLSRVQETIVGATYRGAVKVDEASYTSLQGSDDILIVVFDGDLPKMSRTFGGPGDDDLTRLAASDLLVAMTGTFNDTIHFPDADSLSSNGLTDAFVYVLPAW